MHIMGWSNMQKEFNNIFEVPVKGKDGEEMFLKQFEGKILIFVNTTGECGNAPQWPIIEKIAEEYKDKNVQVIYVPTNDYCGSVTYNDYKDGITCAADSANYAKIKYNVDGYFTELLSSRNVPWVEKVADFNPDTKIWTFNPDKEKDLKQDPRDHLFRFLMPNPAQELVKGNFHKFITNKNGMPVAQFTNHIFNEGPKDIEDFKKVLDEILEKGYTDNSIFGYEPYKENYK